MKKSVGILTPYIEQEKEERRLAHEAAGTLNEEAAGAAKILLATVKGDVHDIGKNIVGVVLACNGYEIIDLGVMVPADKILETAIRENVDIVGLSGLITPSLDEMVHVAKEMKRRGMTQPLLIGGATTSRIHTAVKIAQSYDNGVVHVLDASRSVTVAGNLLNEENKSTFLAGIDVEYEKARVEFEKKRGIKQYVSLEVARTKALAIDWEHYTPPKPTFLGTKVFPDYDQQELRDIIDWNPFFITWEMRGKYPEILQDPNSGVEATKLFNDANALLDKMIAEKWLTAKGVVGYWETVKVAPDTLKLTREDGSIVYLEHLRQQIKKAPGQPNHSLADFVKPEGAETDYVGAFAVSIHGIEPHIQRYIDDQDDYNKIMLQALCDRLAEAFAEVLHKRTRKEFWAYVPEEALSKEEIIKETYRGIRPAPGYPACPDHTEKYKLFDLLNATDNAGIILTEALAMYPASSVCGWYFSHPQSSYFGIGKIQPDQIEEYARRKNMSLEDISRWLSFNLD